MTLNACSHNHESAALAGFEVQYKLINAIKIHWVNHHAV